MDIMPDNIDQILNMLSWENDEATQAQGIQLAQKIRYLSIFIQPVEGKHLWENCAKVIASKEDDALALYLTDLFQWLQDMNWPGAEIIYRRLLHFEGPELNTAFSICFNMAIVSRDAVWTEVLENFRKDKLL